LKQDPKGNLDRIFANLIPQAPVIKQAESKLQEDHRALALAELDLRYCDVVSEIDGVVTGRDVNPGNNVAAGIAQVPEASEHTSIKERIDHVNAQGRADDLKAAREGSVAGSIASAGLEEMHWHCPIEDRRRLGSLR